MQNSHCYNIQILETDVKKRVLSTVLNTTLTFFLSSKRHFIFLKEKSNESLVTFGELYKSTKLFYLFLDKNREKFAI